MTICPADDLGKLSGEEEDVDEEEEEESDVDDDDDDGGCVSPSLS